MTDNSTLSAAEHERQRRDAKEFAQKYFAAFDQSETAAEEEEKDPWHQMIQRRGAERRATAERQAEVRRHFEHHG